jgi:hypothetical protein
MNLTRRNSEKDIIYAGITLLQKYLGTLPRRKWERWEVDGTVLGPCPRERFGFGGVDP